jgi:hypothetical protein
MKIQEEKQFFLLYGICIILFDIYCMTDVELAMFLVCFHGSHIRFFSIWYQVLRVRPYATE